MNKIKPIKFEMDLTKVNKNGRRYCPEALKRAVAEYNDKEFKYGNLGTTGDMSVNMSQASHEVTELNIDEQGVISGEITVLGFGMGVALEQMYIAEMPLAIVPRGMGQLREVDGVVEIYEYKLVSFDVIQEEDSSLT